ncbi:MAG: CoA transferase, partial [Xanthobacteraceae bacterium]
VGRPQMKDDKRFHRLTERVQHIEYLYGIVEEEAVKHSNADWIAFCDRVSIPCMPVLSLGELPDDAHMKAVGMFGYADHPSEGRYRVIRRPVSFSSSPFRIRRHAPRLGEHTDEILQEIGAGSDDMVLAEGAPSGRLRQTKELPKEDF